MKRKRTPSPCKMPPSAHLPQLAAPPFPLTDLERRLFELLLNVVRHDKLDLTLRVAGGWVRDKLLHPEKDFGTAVDIDIALDKMLGREFAERINLYLEQHGLEARSAGVIAKNPEQSKHLETATMRVLDVSLDIVNLRTETYSHDSRIPDIAIGTPEEDARRRDLTINALFYNINTGELEDFTGCGVEDIKNGVIRTPLAPLTTLLDDPLRALRAVRFASRLGFTMDEELFKACRDERVHEALGEKVSRERVGTEVDGMLKGKNPTRSVELLVELGLVDVVFRLPTETTGGKALPAEFGRLAQSALMNSEKLGRVEGVEERLLRYAAVLAPLSGCLCMFAEGKKKKEVAVALYVMRGELRLSAKDALEVVSMHEAADRIQGLVHRGVDRLGRLEVGRVIREAGKGWRGGARVGILMEMEGREGGERETEVLVRSYEDFEKRVLSLGLEGIWEVRPAVDGNEVLKVLNVKKGPVVGEIMKQQVEWMIENPGVGKEKVLQWLKEKYGARLQT